LKSTHLDLKIVRSFTGNLFVHHEQLPGGWLVATNLDNEAKESIIRLAAKISGLKYGTDIVMTPSQA